LTHDFFSHNHCDLVCGFQFGCDRIRHYHASKPSQWITNLLADLYTREYSARLFELAVHHRFRSGMEFQPTAVTPGAPSLAIDILKVDKQLDYFCSSLRSVQYLGKYQQPVWKNYQSIDSVWLSNTTTVLFQMTVSPHHGIEQREVTDLIEELPGNAKNNVHIVFVVPGDDNSAPKFQDLRIEYPIGALDSEEVQSYVYYMNLEEFGFSVKPNQASDETVILICVDLGSLMLLS
jgi:hypothetical protein